MGRRRREINPELKYKSVAVLTTERCGASWMCAFISEVHRQLYGGEPIYWDYEISRIRAIDPKYDLPKTHCTVYYVDPQWLLDMGWEKIIIMQRDYEELREAICRYWNPELTVEEVIEKYPEWEPKLKLYYELEFGKKIDDPRIYYTHLSDLNNYPIDEMNGILEFLEYPMQTEEWVDNKCYLRQRTPMFVVKIQDKVDRDWDIQATCINKGHGFDPFQEAMIKHTGCKGMLPLVKDIEVNEYTTQHGYRKSKGQYINFEYPNPFKLTPEEIKYQNGTRYRIIPDAMPDVLEVLGYLD